MGNSPDNGTDPIVRILKSPEIIAWITAIILVIIAMFAPAFGVPSEVYQAFRARSAVALLLGIQHVTILDLSGWAGIAILSYAAMTALSLVLTLIPTVARYYVRLSNLAAVIFGGVGVVGLIMAMFNIAQGIINNGFVSLGGRPATSVIYPAFGAWAFVISVLLTLTMFVLPYFLTLKGSSKSA